MTGVEAEIPCDTTVTETDLNADDKVLLWRPEQGTCSSLCMDNLCKHKDECINNTKKYGSRVAVGHLI